MALVIRMGQFGVKRPPKTLRTEHRHWRPSVAPCGRKSRRANVPERDGLCGAGPRVIHPKEKGTAMLWRLCGQGHRPRGSVSIAGWPDRKCRHDRGSDTLVPDHLNTNNHRPWNHENLGRCHHVCLRRHGCVPRAQFLMGSKADAAGKPRKQQPQRRRGTGERASRRMLFWNSSAISFLSSKAVFATRSHAC